MPNLNFIPQGANLTPVTSTDPNLTMYRIYGAPGGTIYISVPKGQEAAYTIPATFYGSGQGTKSYTYQPNLPAGQTLQQYTAQKLVQQQAAAQGVTLPPAQVVVGQQAGGLPVGADRNIYAPNPDYAAAVAQIDPIAAQQMFVDTGKAGSATYGGMNQTTVENSGTFSFTGSDGKTYYYVPQSWTAGGGGTATLSPEAAAAMGGTAFTMPTAANPKIGQAYNPQGYVFANDPGQVMPDTAGVSYTPGTNTFAKDLANFAAQVALPVTAMFAPALLPATLGAASVPEGAVLGGGVGGIAGGYQGAALGAIGGGLAAGLGGMGGATSGLSPEELAAVGGLELPSGMAASGAGSTLGTSLGAVMPGALEAAGGATGGLAPGGFGGLTASDYIMPGALEAAGSATGGAAPGGFGGATASDAGLGYVMPGAEAAAGGATGAVGSTATSGGGLNSLLGQAGDWALSNPTKALGALGSLLTLGGGLAGAIGGSSASTSPTGAGGGGTGGPLPYRAPLNRAQTPYPGDYKTYGQTAAPGGGGGWNFFNPAGPAPAHARGGPIHAGPLSALPPTRHSGALMGPGGGQDDLIDAKVANGEYVVDASTVSDLGDGSNDAGAAKLDQLVQHVRKHKRGGAKGLPPKAKSPLAYIGSKS
jgi:hypothetical protein